MLWNERIFIFRFIFYGTGTIFTEPAENRWIFLFLLPFGFQCHLLHTDVWGKLKFSDTLKTDRDWQAAMHSVCFMAGERENKDRNEQVLHQNGP